MIGVTVSNCPQNYNLGPADILFLAANNMTIMIHKFVKWHLSKFNSLYYVYYHWIEHVAELPVQQHRLCCITNSSLSLLWGMLGVVIFG